MVQSQNVVMFILKFIQMVFKYVTN